ncbi:hypothetical protein AB0D90_14615 [Streptomyces althioticus]|uniref:hypothetical protein n=1 Tax=Streptomyces althioticus TaxID=83380 RepID=UPI00340BECC3
MTTQPQAPAQPLLRQRLEDRFASALPIALGGAPRETVELRAAQLTDVALHALSPELDALHTLHVLNGDDHVHHYRSGGPHAGRRCTACNLPAFFEPGHVYQLSNRDHTSTLYFRCTSIEQQPGSGDRHAFGWERTGDSRHWRPASLDELDYRNPHNDGWSDVTFRRIHLLGCSAGCTPIPDAVCLCEDTPVAYDCPDHGVNGCEPDDHTTPPTVAGEVI